MLKILIVDDEQFVIDGLKNALNWTKFGIDVVGEATDGQEAIEFIRNNNIDILFTDIKMPIMDGIQLIELIRTEKRNIKIVILSGYEDFHYARSAIRNQVFEYLLKPITIDKLEQLVMSLSEQCKDEHEKHQENIKKEKQLQESLPLMKEHFYLDLLHGVYQNKMYSLLGLDLSFSNYKVAVLHIDSLVSNSNQILFSHEKELLIIEILDILKLELRSAHNIVPIQYDPLAIGLLFKFHHADSIDLLLKTLEQIQTKVFKYIGVTISFGIGTSYHHITQIYDSFQEAEKALNYKLYYGNNSIIYYKDIVNIKKNSINIIEEFRQDLINSIDSRDSLKAEQTLRDIYTLLKENKGYTIKYVKKLGMEIVSILSFALYDKDEHLQDIYQSKEELFEYIQNLETLDDILNTLIHMFCIVIQYLNKQAESKNKNVINIITNYINSHISDDITLDKIANQVFLTPNYIGYIFKDEMGISFSEYLTQVRMEHAKELLKKPENKIYEVSLKVGYKNPHYFSKLFKKHTGLKPSQYK